MSYDYELQDGYLDQLSGEKISFHREDEPWKVGFKPKNPGSVFKLPEAILNLATSVDFGAGGGLTQQSSGICGEYAVLFFPPISEGSSVDLWSEDWSAFLSQIEELHNAMPPYLGVFVGWEPIVIDSPEFKAPEGIFNYFSSSQPTFKGSTFKVAPRVFGDVVMSITTSWPPGSGDYLSISYPWDPFDECPNVEYIEFQGTLGEYCEKIYGSYLTYKDEDGYERVEAYPDGGRPKIIANAIQLGSFELDSGSSFPMWDCSQLEICISPVFANEVVLPTRSGTVSLPIGPDIRSATNLKYYFNGIKSIVRGYPDGELRARQPCPLVFGLKLLGIDLPEGAPALQYVEDTHMLWRHQMSVGEERFVGITATPQVVKDYFNFSLGSALSSFYGSDTERLLMPETELPVATHVNRYGEVQVEEEYVGLEMNRGYYYVEIVGSGGATGFKIPKLVAPNLKVLNGWLNNTLSFARSGGLSFSFPGGPTISVDVKYYIPAPPNHKMALLNGYKYTCSYLSGNAIPYTSNKPPSTVNLVFSVPGDYEEDTYPIVVLNAKDFSLIHSDELDLFIKHFSEEAYQALWKLTSTDTPVSLDFEIALCKGGVVIEPVDTSAYTHVSNWQDGFFYKAQIDPTTIDNIIIPVGGSTKVDGAYRHALDIATPLRSSVKYIDHRSLPEPIVEDGLGTYQPNFTIVYGAGVEEDLTEKFKFKLEEIDIPVFKLTNRNNQVYDTWTNFFSYLIYGDIAGFKN